MPSKCSSKWGFLLSRSHSITSLATSSGTAASRNASATACGMEEYRSTSMSKPSSAPVGMEMASER